MREFKNHILAEIRSIQKSIEDLDATVKENKDDIKSLSHGSNSRCWHTNTPKNDKIKELTE